MTEPDALTLSDFPAGGNSPPIPLPSIEQLQQLLSWSQAAPVTLTKRPPETWRDLAHGASRILPFLWAGYPGSPFTISTPKRVTLR